MNYYIFRHGETFESKHNVPYGDRVKSAKILPEGIPAIKRVSEYLIGINSDVNISSPFIRCKQTVRIVQEITQKTFNFDDRLGEYLETEETFNQMAERVENFIADIKKSGCQNVIICTHGGIIAALTYFLIEGTFEEHQLYNFPTPGVLVSIVEGKITRKDFNNTNP